MAYPRYASRGVPFIASAYLRPGACSRRVGLPGAPIFGLSRAPGRCAQKGGWPCLPPGITLQLPRHRPQHDVRTTAVRSTQAHEARFDARASVPLVQSFIPVKLHSLRFPHRVQSFQALWPLVASPVQRCTYASSS